MLSIFSQEEKVWAIFSTFEVLKLFIFKLVKEEHPENIKAILVTLLVSKYFKFKDFNEEQK
jgi:hypothetical protein